MILKEQKAQVSNVLELCACTVYDDVLLYVHLDLSLYKYCNLIGHKQETKQLRTTCNFLKPLEIQIL